MSALASEILQIVVSALVAFLFGEKLYTWIFVKEDKAAKQTDNFAKLTESFQSAIQALQSSNQGLQAQLERSNNDSSEKQEVIIQQQKDLFGEREEKAQLREELAVVKCRECRRHGCKRREPQTGY